MYYILKKRFTFKRKGLIHTKRKYKDFDITQMKGYKAITRIEKFIKKNKQIIPVMCDDSGHATSYFYLIPHKTKKEYWGTTALFVPQCSSEQNVFFLYPENLDELIKELQKLQKTEKKLNKNNSDFVQKKCKKEESLSINMKPYYDDEPGYIVDGFYPRGEYV